MEFFHNLSDDQIAVIGGLAALAASGALMYVSYFVGPANRRRPQIPSGEWRGDLVAQPSETQNARTGATTSRKAA